MDDWSDVRAALLEVRATFEAEGMAWRQHVVSVQHLVDLLDHAAEPAFARAVTSGEVWGHMGSLFDVALRDARRFAAARLRLASTLEAHGVTSKDVQFDLAFLRGEAPPGWHRAR